MTKPIALVTGGTRGLGREISRALGTQEYSVIALYHSDEKNARSLEAEAKNKRWDLRTARVDLHSAEQIEEFFRSLPADQPVQVLVNNASPTFQMTPMHKWMREEVESLFLSSVVGAFHLTQKCIPLMKKAGKGRIVNILSSNVTGSPANGSSAYTMAKYALLGLTKSLAIEYARHGIHSNAVSPGAMSCGIFETWPELLQESIRKASPDGKVLDPAEVARKVAYLVSAEADSLNGTNIEMA